MSVRRNLNTVAKFRSMKTKMWSTLWVVAQQDRSENSASHHKSHLCFCFSQTNPHERNVSKLKRYLVLLEQLKAQEECQKAHKKRSDDIGHTLAERETDMENPILDFSIYDPLRNSGARSLRMARQEQYEKQRNNTLSSAPNFITPYLVRFANEAPNANESIEIYEKCLRNIQTDYTDLLNHLQQMYEQVWQTWPS